MSIKSMTGYGNFLKEQELFSVEVTIKSVNNKYLSLNIHAPKTLSYCDDFVKKALQENNIKRGNIDCYCSVKNDKNLRKTISLNEDNLKKYADIYNQACDVLSVNKSINTEFLLRRDGVLEEISEEVDAEILEKAFMECISLAVEKLNQTKIDEGKNLKKAILKYLKNITKMVQQIEAEYLISFDQRVSEYRNKVMASLEKMNLDINKVIEDRLTQEIVILSDKMQIDEEITRLKSHIDLFRKTINQKSPVGKKCDFIIQELNRETNTIVSKSQNIKLSNLAIDIKSNIEKIREQIQNIE